MPLHEVNVNSQDYRIIKVTMETLDVSESYAIGWLLEIGLFNILNYHSGNTSQKHREVDEKLSKGRWPELVVKIKAIMTEI